MSAVSFELPPPNWSSYRAPEHCPRDTAWEARGDGMGTDKSLCHFAKQDSLRSEGQSHRPSQESKDFSKETDYTCKGRCTEEKSKAAKHWVQNSEYFPCHCLLMSTVHINEHNLKETVWRCWNVLMIEGREMLHSYMLLQCLLQVIVIISLFNTKYIPIPRLPCLQKTPGQNKDRCWGNRGKRGFKISLITWQNKRRICIKWDQIDNCLSFHQLKR